VARATQERLADERTIYFARASSGPPECGVASRASANDPFDAPSRVTELDAVDALSHPTWLSPDGCTLYFVSNRAGSNALDVHRATKPKWEAQAWRASSTAGPRFGRRVA